MDDVADDGKWRIDGSCFVGLPYGFCIHTHTHRSHTDVNYVQVGLKQTT